MSSGSNFRTVLTFSSTWLLLTAFVERLHEEIGQTEELMLMLMWRRRRRRRGSWSGLVSAGGVLTDLWCVDVRLGREVRGD